jgi:hypothetical protein
MSNSKAQDVHANNPQGAVDAYLHKYDIHDTFGQVDAEAASGTQMYYGTGNSITDFHIEQNNTLGFQLALKEHYRTGDDIAPTNTIGDTGAVANFVAPAGAQIIDPAHDVSSASPNRAAWSFDFAVATGLNGAKTSLSDFTFKLQVTQNGTNTHVFTLDAANHTWVDQANPAVGFGGDDFNHAATASVQSHVAENSVNLAFLAAAFGPLATSTAAGTTYDIQLEAFQGVQLVGLVHDHVQLA